MKTISHADRAAELFLSGYNCAQSVFGAFCDVTGMEFEAAMRLSSSFGGGMGRLREVCGTVSSMFMIAGSSGDTAIRARTAAKRHTTPGFSIWRKHSVRNTTPSSAGN